VTYAYGWQQAQDGAADPNGTDSGRPVVPITYAAAPGHHAAAASGPRPDWSQQRVPSVAAPSAWGATEAHDPVAADIRNSVIGRLQKMNAMQGQYAWDRRTSAKPLGPHALAFLYRDPVSPRGELASRGELATHGARPAYAVALATRLFSDGDDVRDLGWLLHRLAGLARDRNQASGDFDPRDQMADRTDEMSAAAEYIGLAVSTLDTPAGTWDQVRASAAGPLDVAGRCLALLTDGTHIVLDRGGHRSFGAVRIRSSHDLNMVPGNPIRPWSWQRDLPTQDGLAPIWSRMAELHRAIRDGQLRREPARRTR